jgi:hypothetical protein
VSNDIGHCAALAFMLSLALMQQPAPAAAQSAITTSVDVHVSSSGSLAAVPGSRRAAPGSDGDCRVGSGSGDGRENDRDSKVV